MNYLHVIDCLLFTLLSFFTFGQERVTTIGVQFKPIISSDFIGTEPQEEQIEDINYTITPRSGYAFGMVIRKGLTKQISLETGINYTRKSFNLSIVDDLGEKDIEDDFIYVIYEIPVTGLIYVQLGRQLYLNTSFGLALDFLPSDWETVSSEHYHKSFRTSWVMPALLANVGFEWRTEKDGYFYIGSSYKRPFTNITTARVGLIDDNQQIIKESAFDMLGNYLMLDLRYFFHENPERKFRRK